MGSYGDTRDHPAENVPNAIEGLTGLCSSLKIFVAFELSWVNIFIRFLVDNCCYLDIVVQFFVLMKPYFTVVA